MENEYRQIERMLYHNPIINMDEFPPLDDCELAIQDMESLTFDYFSNSLAYTYIRIHNGKWFVDIYFYFELNDQIHKEHFIIAPGFQMTEEDEKSFLVFLTTDMILFKDRVCEDYVGEIAKAAPELNIKDYKNISIALSHTYFASFRSGIREQLFKAGLEYVAMEIDFLDGWNIIGRNVEEAFDIPIKLLRKLNYHGGIENVLGTKYRKKNALMVYKQYHSILNNLDKVNEFQIYYLRECMKEEKVVDKKFLIELADLESGEDPEDEEYIDGYEVYGQIKEYQLLCDEVNGYEAIFPKYPSLAGNDYGRFYETYCILKSYVVHQTEFEREMEQYARKCKKYIYEDSDYIICIANSVKDIFEESNQQHNCLFYYLTSIIEGEMTVVFMREKTNRNKSLVTMEIDGDSIKQAKACCNASPSIKEMKFIEKFAKAKGLKYSGLEHAGG